jgi:hypothetical protein
MGRGLLFAGVVTVTLIQVAAGPVYADCNSAATQFRESHKVNFESMTGKNRIRQTCNSVKVWAQHNLTGGSFENVDCDRDDYSETEKLQFAMQAQTIRADHALAAYIACLTNSRTGGGFFAWYERIPNSSGFIVKFQFRAPYVCNNKRQYTNSDNSNIYLCDNEAEGVRIVPEVVPAQAAESVCPGAPKTAFDRINKADGSGTRYPADNPEKNGDSVVCNPKAPFGTLVLTFNVGGPPIGTLNIPWQSPSD